MSYCEFNGVVMFGYFTVGFFLGFFFKWLFMEAGK